MEISTVLYQQPTPDSVPLWLGWSHSPRLPGIRFISSRPATTSAAAHPIVKDLMYEVPDWDAAGRTHCRSR